MEKCRDCLRELEDDLNNNLCNGCKSREDIFWDNLLKIVTESYDEI
tara:strand:+ start:1014 stop:1151 length:138 start_codon:yes stop_codon:yes gene_type:complete